MKRTNSEQTKSELPVAEAVRPGWRTPFLGKTGTARVLRGAIVAGVLTGVLSTNAQASVPDLQNVYHGCLSPVITAGTPQPPPGYDTLTLIDTALIYSCPGGRPPVSWNQTGPMGPQGLQGIQGPQGAPGNTGPAGPNIDATTNTIGSVLLDAPASGPHPIAFTRDSIVPIANGGTGSATKNFVDLSTDQSVAGKKTFSSAIVASGGVTFGDGTTQSTKALRSFSGAVNANGTPQYISGDLTVTRASAGQYVIQLSAADLQGSFLVMPVFMPIGPTGGLTVGYSFEHHNTDGSETITVGFELNGQFSDCVFNFVAVPL